MVVKFQGKGLIKSPEGKFHANTVNTGLSTPGARGDHDYVNIIAYRTNTKVPFH